MITYPLFGVNCKVLFWSGLSNRSKNNFAINNLLILIQECFNGFSNSIKNCWKLATS